MLGVSTATLREQMEVARSQGFIEVHPRTGIKKKPYEISQGLSLNLAYGIALNSDHFSRFSDFRKHIESGYWREAVSILLPEDIQKMTTIIDAAFRKLQGHPTQNPQEEHRSFHQIIYRRLNNPFVEGVIEAYWNVYEEMGMAVYTDLRYLENVWGYHKRIVNAIEEGNFDQGYLIFLEHIELINTRESNIRVQKFE
jgi:DNA-binding FadR family transcriptional regulator